MIWDEMSYNKFEMNFFDRFETEPEVWDNDNYEIEEFMNEFE